MDFQALVDWVMNNYQLVLAALGALLGAYLAVAILVPGDQGEGVIRKILAAIDKLKNK